MGMAIALNLKQKGFDVVIRDIRPEIENKAREYGMDVANSPADLASKTDFIIIVVVNATQVHHVLFGSDGVTDEFQFVCCDLNVFHIILQCSFDPVQRQ